MQFAVRNSTTAIIVLASVLGKVESFLTATVTEWRFRSASRASLRNLDEAALHDVGIARSAALAEGNKPFWRR